MIDFDTFIRSLLFVFVIVACLLYLEISMKSLGFGDDLL